MSASRQAGLLRRGVKKLTVASGGVDAGDTDEVAGVVAGVAVVEERVGHRPPIPITGGVGDIRLLTIPATVRLCQRVIDELAQSFVLHDAPFLLLGPTQPVVSVMLQVQAAFVRDHGTDVALARMLSWIASVVEYRAVPVCGAVGILLGMIVPGAFTALVSTLCRFACIVVAMECSACLRLS